MFRVYQFMIWASFVHPCICVYKKVNRTIYKLVLVFLYVYTWVFVWALGLQLNKYSLMCANMLYTVGALQILYVAILGFFITLFANVFWFHIFLFN